jgi:Uncharacterized protein involved in exopolysaccharide biosynthesis
MDNTAEEKSLMKALDGSGSDFSIQNIISFAWRLKWWILACVVVSLSISYVYIKMQTPTYKGYSKAMFIDYTKSTSEISVIEDITGKRQGGRKDDELIVLRSPNLMGKVVKTLGLNTRYYQYKIPLFHTKVPFFRHVLAKKVCEFYHDEPFEMELVFNPLYSEDALPGYIEMNFSAVDSKSYELESAAIGGTRKVFPSGTVHNFSDSLKFPGVTVVLSNPNNSHMIKGDQYKAVYAKPESLGPAFRGGLSVSLEPGLTSQYSNVIVFSYTDINPKRAEDILNTLVDEYNKEAKEYKSVGSLSSLNFINDRLAEISAQLGDVEIQYRNYQTLHEFVDGEGVSSSAASGYEQQLIELNLQKTYLSMVRSEIDGMRDGEFKIIAAGVGISDGGVSQIIGQYNSLVTERARLLANSSENNPSVLNYNEQIRTARNSASIAVENLSRIYQVRESELNKQYGKAKKRYSDAPTRELDLAQISRQQKIIEPLYIKLNEKREDIQLSMFNIPDNARVLEPAYCSRTPIAPNKKSIFMIALLLGILAPIAVMLLRSLLRTKVENKEDIKKYIDSPILASIPKGMVL